MSMYPMWYTRRAAGCSPGSGTKSHLQVAQRSLRSITPMRGSASPPSRGLPREWITGSVTLQADMTSTCSAPITPKSMLDSSVGDSSNSIPRCRPSPCPDAGPRAAEEDRLPATVTV